MPNVGYFPKPYPNPLSVGPQAFVPERDNLEWFIDGTSLLNRVTLAAQRFRAQIHLPHGVSVTKLYLKAYRVAGVIMLELCRDPGGGLTQTMAIIIPAWDTGDDESEDTGISYSGIDNENYHYFLMCHLDPSAAVGDVIFRKAKVYWE